jgi:DNA-binding transcriptional ArsR family regulator
MKRPSSTPLHATEHHFEAFKALAHTARLEIFFFLVRRREEVPAGDIQAELEIPGPTLSHHLDLLRRAGLVQSRRGRNVHLLLDQARNGFGAGSLAHRVLLKGDRHE